MSYERKVREAAMDLTRLQGLPVAVPLDRVRNDQQHRIIHWVQLLMQPGQQRSVSFSGSSGSAKLSKGAQRASQSPDVKAPSSKVDKLASTVKLLADRSEERTDRVLEAIKEAAYWNQRKRARQRQRIPV